MRCEQVVGLVSYRQRDGYRFAVRFGEDQAFTGGRRHGVLCNDERARAFLFDGVGTVRAPDSVSPSLKRLLQHAYLRCALAGLLYHRDVC